MTSRPPGSYPEPTGVPSTANKYAQDLACLAISDKNKKYLLGYGCVALLRRVLDQKYDDQVRRAPLPHRITIAVAEGGARLAALQGGSVKKGHWKAQIDREML
jgi:hypothetical protein